MYYNILRVDSSEDIVQVSDAPLYLKAKFDCASVVGGAMFFLCYAMGGVKA